MALTDDELKALGLYAPAPDVSTVLPGGPNAMPAPINGASPSTLPQSILGDKIAPGAPVTKQSLSALPHDVGQQTYQDLMPKITAAPGTTDYFRQRQEQLDFKQAHPWGDPISAHPGTVGKILHGLSIAGNIAGNIVAPGTMSMIPGTELHNAALARGNEQGLATAEEEQNKTTEAQAKTTAAEAEKEKADAALNPKTGLTPEETTLHDLMTGNAGHPRINPDTNKPYTYMEAYSAVQEAKAGAKPEKPAHVTYDQGIPVSVTDEKGKTYDVNDPKLPPALKPLVDSATRAHGQHVSEDTAKQAAAFTQANSRQNKAEDFQQQEKGRDHLQKAEDTYREASEKADTLRSVVQAAKSGNMVAGSLQPLLAVLGVTTMEGVKRINNTELENVQGAGSLWDQIKGKVGQLKEGQPIDADLQKNITDLADMLQKSAYTKYQGAHQSITKRYGLTDEQPLAGPGGTNEPQRPANVPANFVYKKDGPKGEGWYRP